MMMTMTTSRTTPTTGSTTEMTRPRLQSLTVRQRLTIAVAALTALVLLVVGSALYLLEARRTTQSIDATLTQEVGELRALQVEGRDPETQKPFASPDRLLEVFLSRNLPDPDETLWSFPREGTAVYVGSPEASLRRSPDLASLARGTGGLFSLDVAGREYRIAVQPINQGTARASLVVTHDVSATREPLRELMLTYALIGALSVLLVAAFSSWLAGRLLRPVTELRDAAQSITGGDLHRRLEVTGHDDLADLQRTFNAMLDRLEDAFAAQRHLLDDAAHELRTPLTVLQGHLEVLDVHDPADVAATRSMLLDETERMARLVSDLLLLAKAERPDFVKAEPSDVSLLVVGLVERARGLADRRWTVDAAPELTAVLDVQRITQAMLQLADNAARHTAVGEEIGLGAAVHGSTLELWVRDTGSGVPEELRDRVFQRFTQAGSSEGFGLGLSIVSAIAEAHGGTVRLDPATPETGATFRLALPLEGP